MLRNLVISNLAVVEKAEASFGPGLNVITGETGAGKSVLMGALGLVLGGRADASLVRDGAVEAEVTATFDDCVLRRTVTREGRSRAWSGEESVTLAELRALGSAHLDIHGPRANARLLDDDFQREALDAFGGVSRAEYTAAYARLLELRSRLNDLGGQLGEDELAFLRYQVEELEGASLCEDDLTLAERHAAAAHAEELVSAAGLVSESLGGDGGASDILSRLQPRLAAMARHLPAATDWMREAEELTARLDGLSRTVAGEAVRLQSEGGDLAELDARLTLVNGLLRKHRLTDVSSLIRLANEKRARLDAAENREMVLAALKSEIAAAEAAVTEAGTALTARRTKVAAKFERRLASELKGLGFREARFEATVEPVEPGPAGADRVVFRFGPNPGEPMRPLADIASSGEIARVMLALKAVQSRETLGLTLVFDELDANIGGETGLAVGARLREVAKGAQVIAITHLPQSAVFGERHFVVAKTVSGGRTRAAIEEVSGEARVMEIARMLGGKDLTSVVKKHAEELIGLSS